MIIFCIISVSERWNYCLVMLESEFNTSTWAMHQVGDFIIWKSHFIIYWNAFLLSPYIFKQFFGKFEFWIFIWVNMAWVLVLLKKISTLFISFLLSCTRNCPRLLYIVEYCFCVDCCFVTCLTNTFFSTQLSTPPPQPASALG